MWNVPSDEQLSKIPRPYETENIPLQDKLIYLHLFIGGCDWYVAEYSSEDDMFFGYAILNGDTQNSEWGYTSYGELRDIKIGFLEVDNDLYWEVRPAREVAKIKC